MQFVPLVLLVAGGALVSFAVLVPYCVGRDRIGAVLESRDRRLRRLRAVAPYLGGLALVLLVNKGLLRRLETLSRTYGVRATLWFYELEGDAVATVQSAIPEWGVYVFGPVYVLGYVVFLALVLGVESDFSQDIEDPIEITGWFYHNAQFVDVELPNSETINYLNNDFVTEALTVPTILYRAVPVVLLVGAGYLLVKNLAVRTQAAGAKAGATIAVGVAILTIIGTFVFSVSEGGESAQPQLVTSVLIMGVIYPVVFGAIGGYLGGA